MSFLFFPNIFRPVIIFSLGVFMIQLRDSYSQSQNYLLEFYLIPIMTM